MKISELTTDRAADVLCEISAYISNICGDKAVMDEVMKNITLTGKESVVEMVMTLADKISALSPLLLKQHKTDIFGIVAALNDAAIEDISKQNIMITMSQIKEIFIDKDFIDFFRSSMPPKAKRSRAHS